MKSERADLQKGFKTAFNRTIVELKLNNIRFEIPTILSFNRTIVELKCSPAIMERVDFTSFNRTIVDWCVIARGHSGWNVKSLELVIQGFGDNFNSGSDLSGTPFRIIFSIVQVLTLAVEATDQVLEDVKEFGVYADDLTGTCPHLKEHGVTSVAMEGTGNYWQNLYVEVIKHGFEATLSNGMDMAHL